MINLLIFDFDGTLYETCHGVQLALNELLEEKGLTPIDYDLVTRLIGEGSSLIQELDRETQHKIGEIRKFEDQFLKNYDKYVIEHSHLYEGVLEVLTQWKGDLAIVSNKKERYIHQIIESGPLKNFEWKSIIGGDSLNEKKPHPLPLEETLKRTGHQAKHTLMIGDGLPDFLSANAADIQPIMAAYGYGPMNKMKEMGAKYFIPNFKGLLEYI